MSGDHGPSVVVPAALQILSEQNNLHLILKGDEAVLKPQLGHQYANQIQHLSIYHAGQQVEMDELPSHALRNKKNHPCVPLLIWSNKVEPKPASVREIRGR